MRHELLISLGVLLICGFLNPSIYAQKLPAPSRTVYKCEVKGQTVYSDSPCLGAEKIEVEPTRGVNKTTGRVREGADVQGEHRREGLAEALRPLTGLDAKQLDTQSRRMKLTPESQNECRFLDGEIPRMEGEERRSNKQTIAQVQGRLHGLRLRFRKLGC